MSSSVKLISPETPTIYPTAVYIAFLLHPSRATQSRFAAPSAKFSSKLSIIFHGATKQRKKPVCFTTRFPSHIYTKEIPFASIYVTQEMCFQRCSCISGYCRLGNTHTHTQKYIYIYIFKFTTHTHCVHLPTNSTICSNIEQRVATLYQKVLPKKKCESGPQIKGYGAKSQQRFLKSRICVGFARW